MERSPVALLILNGKSTDNPELRSAIELCRSEGAQIHVRVTFEHGDVERYMAEASRLNAETIIAGGGDGTINEVATALVAAPESSRLPLAVLPLGTANDFATSVGIPHELINALRLALHGKAYPVDLGRVNEQRYFINMATGGFGTRITTETPEKLKSALGGLSYVLHGMLRVDQLKPDSCELRGPDFHWAGDALVIGIGNGRQAGGGQRLCPTALINDGLLNASVVTAQELLPAALNSLFGGDDDNPNIVRAEVPWLEIEAPHEMTFNLDGEPLRGRQFRIEICPEAILCRLPPDCPLLR